MALSLRLLKKKSKWKAWPTGLFSSAPNWAANLCGAAPSPCYSASIALFPGSLEKQRTFDRGPGDRLLCAVVKIWRESEMSPTMSTTHLLSSLVPSSTFAHSSWTVCKSRAEESHQRLCDSMRSLFLLSLGNMVPFFTLSRCSAFPFRSWSWADALLRLLKEKGKWAQWMMA